MKVTLLHGQNHRQSSWHVAHLLSEQLSVEALHEFYLPRDTPHFCRGCYRCMELGEDFCPHTAYMTLTMKAMKEADLLIFTIPIHRLRTSGSMKVFLDHYFLNLIVHRPPPSMYHKQAVILASGAGSGMKKAAKDIHTSLTGWGVSRISSYDFRSMTTTQGAVFENIKRRLTTDFTKLASRIKRKQCHKCISQKQKLLFHVMRQMQKYGMEVGELDCQYRKERDRPGRNRLRTDDEQNTCTYFRYTICICLPLYTV